MAITCSLGGPAAVTTLGPLTGTVIRTGNQGDGLRYVDVRLNSSIAGVAYNVRYKDLLTVGVGVGTRLGTGSNIGGKPRPGSGLRFAILPSASHRLSEAKITSTLVNVFVFMLHGKGDSFG